MGTCESNNRNCPNPQMAKAENGEIKIPNENNNHYVSIDKLNLVKKSVCKITYNINNTSIIRTGFFVIINNEKYLIDFL